VKTSLNKKIAVGFAAAMIAMTVVFLVIATIQAEEARRPSADPAQPRAVPVSVVRDDSHRLDQVPNSPVTVVEFLDFECEVCAAFYPTVQSVREDFAGQITFVVRYFPIPAHANSTNAAVAAEAAARQGSLEPMYSRLFRTQAEWGEQHESRAPLFRQFAVELGLDMAQYDADVADPATAARVASDLADGRALGVQSTPSFFVNDRLLRLTSRDDLRVAIEAELAR
jgi:protein-disulfide isomerase